MLLETPANPGLDVCDIAAAGRARRTRPARWSRSTTPPPPRSDSARSTSAPTWSVATGTKALTGHSDLLLGYVATRYPELLDALTPGATPPAAIPGPFDAWLAHRSLATLDLRLAPAERQRRRGRGAARRPLGRASVRWPGLADDPAYAVASAQMRRFPGVVTFDLASPTAVGRFLEAARLVVAATSFGGLHTTADRRAQWGDDTARGLVRLSCGIEDTADLVADIAAALDVAGAVDVSHGAPFPHRPGRPGGPVAGRRLRLRRGRGRAADGRRAISPRRWPT